MKKCFLLLFVVLFGSSQQAHTKESYIDSDIQAELRKDFVKLLPQYLNYKEARITFPYDLSDTKEKKGVRHLAGPILKILQATGVGRRIVIDIREHLDEQSIIFEDNVGLQPYGYNLLNDDLLAWFAKTDAGKAEEFYLFVVDREGHVRDHLKIGKHLAWRGFIDGKPLSVLQSTIDETGMIRKTEIFYRGDSYLNLIGDIFRNELIFDAIKKQQIYHINADGKIELLESTESEVPNLDAKTLYGAKLEEL